MSRLAWNLFDENNWIKAESDETEETSEIKVSTRRNKKVDTFSNIKKRKPNRLCCPTSPRATDAEWAITRNYLWRPVKHWHAEKKKKNVRSQISSLKAAGGGWNDSETWSHFDFIYPVEQLAQRREKPSSSKTKEFKVIILFPASRSNYEGLNGINRGA